jgi:drug/metabolite transporter (DMT)-like permease
MSAQSPVFLLATGVTLNLYAQYITNLRALNPSAHILPWVKFAATMVFAAASSRIAPRHTPTLRQRRLMQAIGILDAVAYVNFCIGFAPCGATLASVVLAASGQVFTAVAARFLLSKRLTGWQTIAIALVCLGLAVRAIPYNVGNAASTVQLSWELKRGMAHVVLAGFLYSLLGVAYESLMVPQAGQPPPPHGNVLWHTSQIGLTAATAYHIAYTWPQRKELVMEPLWASGVSPERLIAVLMGFGVMFNVHMFAQAFVFKHHGALGVSLVNAMRGAAIAVVGALLFCSPQDRQLCLTPPAAASAALVAVGGACWAIAGSKKKAKQS